MANGVRADIERAIEHHKVSKASVGYEHPAAKSNHCGICEHFEAPSACEIVQGTIRREDWCERFKKG